MEVFLIKQHIEQRTKNSRNKGTEPEPTITCTTTDNGTSETQGLNIHRGKQAA